MIVPSIKNEDIGKTFSVSGVTSANAPIGLKNPSTGEYVAFTTADGSGSYTFNIDSNIPLEITTSSQYDASNTTSQSLSTLAPAFSTFGNGNVVGIGNDGPYINNPYAEMWVGTPSYSIRDAGGSTGTDRENAFIANSYTGPGSGATIELEFAGAGEPYGWLGSYPNPEILPRKFGGQGTPLRRWNITNFGKDYQNAVLHVSGEAVGVIGDYQGRTLEEQLEITLADPNTIDAFIYTIEYDDSTPPQSDVYFIQSAEAYYPCFEVNIANDGISAIESYWTNDRTYWNTYQFSHTGGKFTVSIPNNDITEPAHDGTSTGANNLSDLKSAVDNAEFNNGAYRKAYDAIIYGQDSSDIDIIGFPSDPLSGIASQVYPGSAVDGFNNGKITKQELDTLKGYFGKELLVGGVIQVSQQTRQVVSNILLWAWNIVQGVTQTTIAQEMRSIERQQKGIAITDMSGEVRRILTKLQTATGNSYIDNLQVKDNSGNTIQWNFNGSVPTNTNLGGAPVGGDDLGPGGGGGLLPN